MDGATARESASYVGRTFGDFIIREPLGSGGFGLVFRAEQPALGREAVIKVLHARLRGAEAVVQRFLREARLASHLDHPYAAHTYAFGAEADGTLWIAMELVRGTPLERLLEQGPIPLERFVPLLERICEVVQTAHEQGIVHRDLKPGNVMVLSRAGRLLPKLLDFGIAKLRHVDDPIAPRTTAPAPIAVGRASALDAASSLEATMPGDSQVGGAVAAAAGGLDATQVGGAEVSGTGPIAVAAPGDDGRLTHAGAVMGSPLYMAPEQWADAAAVDGRTDLYALGVLCYEALTGRPPFTAVSLARLAQAHRQTPPPPLGGDLPVALDAVIARAMAKRPDDRFAGALELAAAFRAASGLGAEAIDLPALPERLRGVLLTRFPQPIARATAALCAARNAHQARFALGQLVHVTTRWLGLVALSSHAHAGGRSTGPALGEALRGLRAPTVTAEAWLAVARALCQPFAERPDAHPVPELVDAVLGEPGHGLAALAAARAVGEQRGGEDEVRAQLAEAMPRLAHVLAGLEFLIDYPLVVIDARGAQAWMGTQTSPIGVAATGRALAPGEAALLDAAGVPIVSLSPLVQVEPPTPGAADALFLFDGRGRRGARLVAPPDGFELEDEAAWDELGALLGDEQVEAGATSVDEACPFPGLAAFTAGDAARFFGRDRETAALVNRLRVQPLVAVVGASGAGKSSFVQAGVIPALGDGWTAVVARPGPSPFAQLRARLAAAGLPIGDLRREIADHPGALGALLRAAAGARGTRVLLVLDQFEELFTLSDEAERAPFAEAVVRAARTADDPVRVVLTLRDDFLLRADSLTALRSRLGAGLQLLTTPARDELEQILREPVRRAGYEFDDDALPGEMIDAVAERPGALALLSFTANRLWELRDRRFRQLTRKAYDSLGGIGGALAQHAEAMLEALPTDEQRLVREAFRHLVTAEGTRDVLSRAELTHVLGDGPRATAVIEKLVDARLVTASEAESGAERLEITHEALLEAWPRLVAWRTEDRDGARLRGQLRAAARQWEERGRPSGLLWRGDALTEYRLWRARHPGALTASEAAFADASERDASRGRRQRRLALGAVVAMLLVGVVALSLQNRRVGEQRRLAEAASAEAQREKEAFRTLLREQYEDQGRRLLLDDDAQQALAYLVEAARLGADGAAFDLLAGLAVDGTAGELWRVEHARPLVRVRASPDGRHVVTTSYDGTAALSDAASGERRATLTHDAFVYRAEFDPAGDRVVTASQDGTAAIWDVGTGALLQRIAVGHAVAAAAFSSDGGLVVTIGTDDEVRLWRASDGAPVAELRPAGADVPRPKAWSIAGERLAVGDEQGVVRIWQLDRGRLERELRGHTARITATQLSPAGDLLLTASADGTATVVEVATGAVRTRIRHRGPIASAVLAPDGGHVATAADRTAALTEVATGETIATLTGHASDIRRLLYAPDGRTIVTVSDDATAVQWDAVTGRPLHRFVGHRRSVVDAAFSPDGARLTTASWDGTGVAWKVPERSVVELEAGAIVLGTPGALERSPDGTRIALAVASGQIRVWDSTTGAPRLTLSGTAPATSVGFGADGALIAGGFDDGAIRVWDERGVERARLGGEGGTVMRLVFLASGALVSASRDGTLRVWDVDRPRPRHVLGQAGSSTIENLAALGATDVVLSTDEEGTVRAWDAARGVELPRPRVPRTTLMVAPNPDGTRLAGAGDGVAVWSRESGEVLFELGGNIGEIYSASFNPDGELLVTAGSDGTARVWSGRTGKLLAVLDHAEPVIWAVFTTDGRRVATVAADGTVRLWPLPRFAGTAAELASIARCRLPYMLERGVLVSHDPSGCR